MAPFSKANTPIPDFEPKPGALPLATLPGQPSVLLNDIAHLKQFLEQEGREIIITEDPKLHLVWIHNRIFVKPLPRYLLSHAFWKTHLDEGSQTLGDSRSKIHKAAMGFLRTYRYLIKHESDFHIAQQDQLRLIPHDVEWASFCQFVAELGHINDSVVSGRYCYGELRLTRLNFYAPLLLRKFHFEQVHGQYGDFFARLYGPVLFLFAVVSTILSSMQVALAAEPLLSAHWEPIWYLSRWFSMVSLAGAALVSIWLILLWLWIFLDEWIFTVRQRIAKRQNARRTSTC